MSNHKPTYEPLSPPGVDDRAYVEWVNDPGLPVPLCERAAREGRLDYLVRAYREGCTINADTHAAAVKGGHVDCLQYACGVVPPDKSSCAIAAAIGNLDCLLSLHRRGCPWDKEVCEKAAHNGHLDCLRYAHENGCPWGEETCAWAAHGGNLDCLRYAHENGCPWNKRTCESAAREGYLECLVYAHENGCPWDEDTCGWAVQFKRRECFIYARQNGCPWTARHMEDAVTRWLEGTGPEGATSGCGYCVLL